MMRGILLQYRRFRSFKILVFFCLLFPIIPAPASAADPSVESYFWPPGFFHRFGKLTQAQKEIMMFEVEKKVASLRQAGKGLLVKGELMDKLRTDISEFNPAIISDQSGLVVMVRNFPNIYFGFFGPETLLNRNTFIVVKNPRVDRVESTLRQALVITGDFFAFSQAYFKSTVEGLQKALKTQQPKIQTELQESPRGKKKK
jgi:hypothetical protein